MDLEPRERAVLESYRNAPPAEDRSWLVILALGGLVCAVALVLLFFSEATLSFSLLSLVAGLVVMSRGLDRRRRAIMGRIIRKYDEALGGSERRTDGEE